MLDADLSVMTTLLTANTKHIRRSHPNVVTVELLDTYSLLRLRTIFNRQCHIPESSDALVELQRAYEGFKDHEVASHVVEVLAILDRRDEALELLQSAEQKNPDSELLQNVRKRFFSESP